MNTTLLLVLVSLAAAAALFPYDLLDLAASLRWRALSAREEIALRALAVRVWWATLSRTWAPAAWRIVSSAIREAIRAIPTPSEWRTYQESEQALVAFEHRMWLRGNPPTRPSTMYVPSWEILAACDPVVRVDGEHVDYVPIKR